MNTFKLWSELLKQINIQLGFIQTSFSGKRSSMMYLTVINLVVFLCGMELMTELLVFQDLLVLEDGPCHL